MFKAGEPLINTVGLPGAHGATVTGTQGAEVNTPDAAAVAATTAGLVVELHIPKVANLLSRIQAIGFPSAITNLVGENAKPDVTVPNEHLHIVPILTGSATIIPPIHTPLYYQQLSC